MNELKKENKAIYPGAENRAENRAGTSYGRIAYDKASENEKRISVKNKSERINEIRSIEEVESVTELKGDTMEKAVKFEASGDIIEAEITITCNYYCTISVYLNDKLIGTADKTAENHCVFDERSKDGENVLCVVAEGADSGSVIKIVISGKVKKISEPQEIRYFGKDCYAVKQDDRITIFRYNGDTFEKVYSLSGLKASCACFYKDKAQFYVGGKFYSGRTVLYSVEWDGLSIGCMDESIDYGCATVNYNSIGLYLYYVVGGSLCFAYLNDNGYMVPGGVIRKGVKEAEFFSCEQGEKVILKDIYDRYIVCKVYGAMIKDQVNLGKVCRPHIPYGNMTSVICKNGDDSSESGCYSIDITGNKLRVGKPFKDRYPVTVTDTSVVGTENGEPIILEELK